MVQAIIDVGEREDRVLTIIKGKFGLKTKSEAVNFIISKYEEELLEPELRPEFVNKIRLLEKTGKFVEYKDLAKLKKEVEHV
ncbi:MAG: DUF2683 family protein [Candidatus Nanoarchaeia archaeon]